MFLVLMWMVLPLSNVLALILSHSIWSLLWVIVYIKDSSPRTRPTCVTCQTLHVLCHVLARLRTRIRADMQNAIKCIISSTLFFPMMISFNFFFLDLRHITNRKVGDVSIPYLDPFEGLARDLDREESCWDEMCRAAMRAHVDVISSGPKAIGRCAQKGGIGRPYFFFWPCKFETWNRAANTIFASGCFMTRLASLAGLMRGGGGRAGKQMQQEGFSYFLGIRINNSDARPHLLSSEVRNPEVPNIWKRYETSKKRYNDM